MADLRRSLAAVAMTGALVVLGVVVTHRFAPAPPGWLPAQRMFEGRGYERHWRPLDRMAPALAEAVIAAEDARFCAHNGFDWEGVERAMRSNARGKGPLRGGSTISQQTAKNVFLWPGRGWARKGLEAGFTVLIEALWGKRRIMEVYLNVVEWAPGVYGAQAASRRWFGVDADRLNPAQAAALAAILPRPLKWRAEGSGPYVRRRSSKILKGLGAVRSGALDACLR